MINKRLLGNKIKDQAVSASSERKSASN